jgi:hypothetical protein
MCFFIFSFWNLLYFLLHQNEEMNALDRLQESKQERGTIEKIGRREKERK